MMRIGQLYFRLLVSCRAAYMLVRSGNREAFFPEAQRLEIAAQSQMSVRRMGGAEWVLSECISMWQRHVILLHR